MFYRKAITAIFLGVQILRNFNSSIKETVVINFRINRQTTVGGNQKELPRKLTEMPSNLNDKLHDVIYIQCRPNCQMIRVSDGGFGNESLNLGCKKFKDVNYSFDITSLLSYRDQLEACNFRYDN